MKRLLLVCAILSALIVGLIGSQASAAPAHKDRATGTAALIIYVYWGPGIPTGSGVAVYCQTPNGTAKVYTSSQGTAGCIVPTGVNVAVYAWWPESGCTRYYFGQYGQYGLAVWVNTQSGQQVSLFHNYDANLCG